MSSRAFKLAMRDELLGDDAEDDNSFNQPVTARKKKAKKVKPKISFSDLCSDEESNEEQEAGKSELVVDDTKFNFDEEKPEGFVSANRRKKQKAAAKRRTGEKHRQQVQQLRILQEKEEKKKQEKKEKRNETKPEEEVSENDSDEEFDQVLDQFSDIVAMENEQYAQDEEDLKEDMQSHRALSSLLAVKKALLDHKNEMRRVFGSRVVDANNNDNNARGRQRGNQRGIINRRTVLATEKGTWPPYENPGINMSMIKSRNGINTFKFNHKPNYQEMQKKFFLSVDSLNPDNIFGIVQRMPYHIDGLLQLSEIYSMRGDHENSGDFVERTLFCMEACFHTRFNISSACSRLPYRYFENRAFYIALFRHINILSNKGCWRTGLEVCKLLLSLDDVDPVGCLLMIDTFAIQSREHHFLIELFDILNPSKALDLLPNFAFSMALAYYYQEKEEDEKDDEQAGVRDANSCRSNIQLQKAILQFPTTLLRLADKSNLTLPPKAYTTSFFTDPTKTSTAPSAEYEEKLKSVETLVTLYIARSHHLWSVPEIASWVRANVLAVMYKIENNSNLVEEHVEKVKSVYSNLGSLTVYRHVLMTGVQEVISTLPLSIKNSQQRSYDPLPPENNESPYDNSMLRQNHFSTAGNLQMFLSSLYPGFTLEHAQSILEMQNSEDLSLSSIYQMLMAQLGNPDGQEEN